MHVPQVATAALTRIIGRPFGFDEHDQPVTQVGGRVIVAALSELWDVVGQRAALDAPPANVEQHTVRVMQAQSDALDRLVAMLNAAIPDERYHVSRPYLMNESNSYSREFWLFVVEYCRIISGDARFAFNHARRIPTPAMVALMRPFALHQVYNHLPRFLSKLIEVSWQVTRVTPTSATVEWSGEHELASIPPQYHQIALAAGCQSMQGGLSALPPLRYPDLPPARIRELHCRLRGDACCTWEFTWRNPRPRPRKRLIAGTIVSLLLLGVAILGLPGSGALTIFAAALPILIGWHSWRVRSLTHEREQQQEQLLEQQRLAEEQYGQVQRANAELQFSNLNLEQKLGELSALHDIGLALSTSRDLNDLLDRSLRAVTLWLKFDRALVLLVDEERHVLSGGRIIGGTAAMQTLVATLAVPLDDRAALLNRVYHAQRPLLIDTSTTTDAEDQFFAQALGATAFLGTPLMSKGRTVGVLCVDNAESGRVIALNETPLLFTVASQIAAAVEGVRLYQQIEAQNRELERRVQQRTLDLARATVAAQQARVAAEAANEAKSAFLANVSHELRTPLTSILGFSKIIKKRFDDVVLPAISNPDAKMQRATRQIGDNLTIIASEGERLTALIDDVLDLAKIESGKQDWRMEPLRPAEIVGHAATATSALFMHKGLPLILDVPDDLPAIIGDQHRLIQVLINLLSNAVKFTDAGAVTLRVTTDDGRLTADPQVVPIDALTSVVGGQLSVVFTVSDTGIGIAPDDQPRVFDQFKQVGDTLTDKPQGTGLGLAISKQIVERHNGRIWVDSEVGQGSKFMFCIPFVSERA